MLVVRDGVRYLLLFVDIGGMAFGVDTDGVMIAWRVRDEILVLSFYEKLRVYIVEEYVICAA